MASQAHLAHQAPLDFQEKVASQDKLDPGGHLVLKALPVTLGRKVPKVTQVKRGREDSQVKGPKACQEQQDSLENPASPVMALMGEMVREARLEPLDPLVFRVLLALQVLLVFVNHQLVPWKLDYKEGRM
ncbi:hypothetical protein Chor_006885 [Crotalus horridus]